MTYLPPELLHKILSYISQEDKNTFFACVLVNRAWCKSTIPLLWQNPFSLSTSPKIISSYIPFLSKDARTIIGINFTGLSKHSLFDYTIFLRKFDCRSVHRATVAFFIAKNNFQINERYTLNIVDNTDKTILNDAPHILFNELCKLFMTRSFQLDHFIIDTRIQQGCDSFMSMPALLQSIDFANTSLSRLSNFTCAGIFNKSDILLALSKTSRNIRSITIVENARNGPSTAIITPKKSVSDFVLSQRQLSEFTLELCIYFSDTLQALTSQASTLTHLNFRSCWFLYHIINDALSHLRVCKNLVSLVFEQCHTLASDTFKPLADAHFPRLEFFEYSPQFWSYSEWDHFGKKLPKKELESFLCLNGKNLKGLKLGNMIHFCPELIEDVVKYCKNLKSLEVNMDHLENQIFPILKSCRKLEKLVVPKVTMTFRYDIDRILTEIGRHLPFNLQHLDLQGWSLAPTGLYTFLEDYGERIKFIAWNGTTSINRYSDIITGYAKSARRVIKNLYMQGAFNDEINQYAPRQAILELE